MEFKLRSHKRLGHGYQRLRSRRRHLALVDYPGSITVELEVEDVKGERACFEKMTNAVETYATAGLNGGICGERELGP